MLGIGSRKITGGEQQAGLVNGGGHLPAFTARDAQRFLDKQVLARLGGGQHEFVMPIRLGQDDHGGHVRVRPDGVEIGDGLRARFFGPAVRARGVVIPDILDAHVSALLQQIQIARRVNVRDADDGDVDGLARVLRPNRQRGGRQRRRAGGFQEIAPRGWRFHLRKAPSRGGFRA